MIFYIVCLLIVGGALTLDLITKYLAVEHAFNFAVIPSIMKFKLSYNTGAAFSFLSSKSWAQTFFIVLAIASLVAIVGYFVFKMVTKQRMSKWIGVALALIFAGTLGNLIDRISMGKVRDFIFMFYETDIFPAIFNVADVALVSGVITFCFYLLFIDKDGLFAKKNKGDKDGK